MTRIRAQQAHVLYTDDGGNRFQLIQVDGVNNGDTLDLSSAFIQVNTAVMIAPRVQQGSTFAGPAPQLLVNPTAFTPFHDTLFFLVYGQKAV